MKKILHFEDLMTNFCRQHQVSMIPSDEQLHYMIYIDHIAVRCYTHGAYIYFEAELGPLPELLNATDQLYLYLMQLSLFNSLHTQSVISLSKDNRLSVYYKMLLEQCELHDFNAAMELVVEQVEVINDILTRYQKSNNHENLKRLAT